MRRRRRPFNLLYRFCFPFLVLTFPPIFLAATREAGVVYFQRTHVDTLRKHFEKEQAAGHEIRGGQHTYGSLSEKSSNAFVQQVEGCAGACGSGGKENEW